MRLTALPSFVRAKSLAATLRLPAAAVLKEVTVSARKRVYTRFGQTWFEYRAVKDVVLPFAYCARFAEAAGTGRSVVEEDYRELFGHAHAALRSVAGRDRKRTPVVVLLGHQDHGKTTLLQALSNDTRWLESEGQDAMTQTLRTVGTSVGTLVDTPGQDLFYRMRNYGAAVADAFLLVVAADEGVMSQTAESIGIIQGHLAAAAATAPGTAEAKSVPPRVIVAINKCDTLSPPLPPDASSADVLAHPELQALQAELRKYIALEGASFVGISALKGHNVGELQRLLSPAPSTQEQSGGADEKALNGVGVGAVLNVEQNTQMGLQLHVLLLEGSVTAGSCFCAGGWSGTVRSVATLQVAKSTPLVEATAGMGAKISVSLDPDSGSPIPLGAEVLFWPSNRRMASPNPSAFSLSSLQDLPAREALARVAEQSRLAESFGLNALAPEAAARLRNLPAPRFPGREEDLPSEEQAAAVAAGELLEKEEEEEEEKEEEEEQESEQRERLVVLKVDSHMTLHTVLDALDDFAQAQAAPVAAADAVSANAAAFSSSEVAPGRNNVATIIRHGAGDVTPTDSLVAREAGAEIVMYKVKVLSSGGKDATGKKPARLKKFTKIQQVVSHIIGEEGEVANSKTAK